MLVFSDIFMEATSLGGLDRIQKGSIFYKIFKTIKDKVKQSKDKNGIKNTKEAMIDPSDVLDLGMMYSLKGKR